jgi:ABC-type multidrug transport system fused ATPase/permease subunit
MNSSNKDNSINEQDGRVAEGSALNTDDSDIDHEYNKFLSEMGITAPSLLTPSLNTAHPTLCLRRNSSVINKQDGRVAEGSALSADDDDDIEECNRSERDDSPPDELVVLTNQDRFHTPQGLSRSLSNDTFSFIFISGLLSLPFLIAIIVVSFQMTAYSVLTANIIDKGGKNQYNFPPNVDYTVRVTQVLAIIIAIVTQDDVKKVILILRDGYDADVFQGTFGPEATKFKWILSLVLRAAVGLFGLFVIFMLIMQSTTVLDLLLDFTATEFVSLLDDLIFLMLRVGYFGFSMMKAATLCETEYHVSRFKSLHLSAVYFIIIFAVMFSGWSGIYTKQSKGEYLCQRMYIQLGDEFAPALAGLSGIYTINNNEQFGGRVTSSQENNGQGKIGYCEDENVWTLKIQEQLMPLEYDPCLYWVAKSSESKDFDVLKTTSSQWCELLS